MNSFDSIFPIQTNQLFDAPGGDNDYLIRRMEIDPVHNDGELSALRQDTNIDPVIELVDVNMDDIPEGPLVSSDDQFFYGQEHSIQSLKNDRNSHTSTSTNGTLNLKKIRFSHFDSFFIRSDQAPINNSVSFSELAGPNEFLKSQSETRFDLAVFGVSTESPNAENASKIGNLSEKIRRDVKQLGLLCAASDKQKLINILVINQQLNVIDPPPVEETLSTEESRTIKSILKPPTMPQRINKKRNMNLKVSYGVVTAKEVVQSIMDREAADQQHEIEREDAEIAKLSRENEISAVEDELKVMRKLLSSIRSEVVALNKELVQKKKIQKSKASSSDLELHEKSKREKEVQLKEYDEQVRGLREKLKNLKAIHVGNNKAVSQKKKSFELQKKEIGNKVQPSNPPPEIDDAELDSDSY